MQWGHNSGCRPLGHTSRGPHGVGSSHTAAATRPVSGSAATPVPRARDWLTQDALAAACDGVAVADERLRRAGVQHAVVALVRRAGAGKKQSRKLLCHLPRGVVRGAGVQAGNTQGQVCYIQNPFMQVPIGDRARQRAPGGTSICCRSMSLSPVAWSSRLDSTWWQVGRVVEAP